MALAPEHQNPISRILNLLRLERREIGAIYFYAIMGGVIQLSLPLGIQAIIGFVLGATMSTSLKILIGVVVLAVLIGGLIQVNQMKIIEKIQQKIFVRYTMEIAEHIPQLDLKKADNYFLPELVNRFFDIKALQKSIAKLLLDIPTASIQIVFGLTLLAFYHPIFILFGLVLVGVLVMIIYLTGNKGLETSLYESKSKYRVAAWLEEMARVIRSIKFSKGSRMHLKKTDEKVIDYLRNRTSHFRILLFQYRLLVVFKTVITAAVLIIGSMLLINQQLNIGQFIAAEIVIITVINSVEKLINNLDSVYDVLTSIEKVGQVTDKPVETSGTLMVKEGLKGYEVEMSNVGFSYNDLFPALSNISLQIRPGEKVCLMGGEGSGKSTILKLLTGTFSDFTGNIMINKIPINNYNKESLRAHTGVYLSQQDIFQGTLEENLTLGNDTIDRNDVLPLFEKVGLMNFLGSLKDGFDTELDPSGGKLAGSVVRKLLLVRSLVHQPCLILLEDPMSGMDDAAREQIQQLLLDRNNPATVIVSSNDEAFARRCDKIIYVSPEGSQTIVNR